MNHRAVMQSKTMKRSIKTSGAMDNLSRREGPAFDGLTRGVKAQAGAFTLIELLVVIAIIAILAALLLPVLNRARAEGLKADCISNFKQLQACYHMYVDDNSDNLPLNFLGGINSWITYIPSGGTAPSAQNDINTVNIRKAVIYAYNQNPKIYVCPANNYNLTVGGPDSGTPPFRDDFGNTIKLGALVPETRTCSIEYSMGGNGAGSITGPWTTSGNGDTWNTYQKFSQIQATRVASKIVFVDESSGTIDDGAFAMWPMNTGVNAWWNLPGARHDRGAIFSFADGHVEYHHWLGTVVPNSPYQTQGPATGYPGFSTTSISISSSDLASMEDLAWAQMGGPQYP